MIIALCLALGQCFAVSAVDVDKPQDLNTAETFWDIINTGRGINAYSGWGTGLPTGVQARPVYGTTFSYNSPIVGYGGYGGSIVGSYGSNNGVYSIGPGSNYYARVQVPVYTAYSGLSAQPTYENYGTHGGHGFGKYGNSNY